MTDVGADEVETGAVETGAAEVGVPRAGSAGTGGAAGETGIVVVFGGSGTAPGYGGGAPNVLNVGGEEV